MDDFEQQLDAWLADRDKDANKQAKGKGRARLGLGIYQLQETLDEEDSSTRKKTGRRN